MSRLSAHLFGIGIWVCLWWALGMASEGRSLRDYTLDAWRDELPQAAVLALAQDRQGYLWIGTYEGLVRFDGVRFATFDKRTTPRLPQP
jgi:ligand-binding sensor domain-containing protein